MHWSHSPYSLTTTPRPNCRCIIGVNQLCAVSLSAKKLQKVVPIVVQPTDDSLFIFPCRLTEQQQRVLKVSYTTSPAFDVLFSHTHMHLNKYASNLLQTVLMDSAVQWLSDALRARPMATPIKFERYIIIWCGRCLIAKPPLGHYLTTLITSQLFFAGLV